jgi:hypothetical protein
MIKQFLLSAAPAVFIGTWQAENDPDSSGKSGTSAFYTCQWSTNGNYLIADQKVTNMGTTTNNLSICSYTVNTFLSSTDYTFKVQSSEDGEHWETSMQGKAHKIR